MLSSPLPFRWLSLVKDTLSPAVMEILEAPAQTRFWRLCATVIMSFEFGVAVIESDQDLDGVVYDVRVTLDVELELEKSVASPVLVHPISGTGAHVRRRRLQTMPPPFHE
jgi:hypothetical protein